MPRREVSHQDHPFEDDYRGFDVREDETARGPLILAIAAGVLLIFAGVIWNTYRQGIRTLDSGPPPPIVADVHPYKHRPADKGGQPTPHLDMHFYDTMDASQREPAEVREETSVTLAGGDPVPVETEGPRNLLRPAPLSQPGEAPPETAPAETAAATPDSAAGQASPMIGVTLRAPEPVQPLASKARFSFAESGPFLVQLAALRSQESAETEWRRVTASAPQLYHGAHKRIQRADLGAEGVFYRLRVGAFASRDEAAIFCDAVKATGSNCIVVTG